MKTNLLVATAMLAALAAGAQKRPNVVLVLTDGLGYGDLHCTGNPHAQTPNLDRLWNEGVRLTDFHTEPEGAPARAALLTGRYAVRSGVWRDARGRSLIDPDQATLPSLLGANGYRTALFGAWNLGREWPSGPAWCGFGETLTFGGDAPGSTADSWGNDTAGGIYMHNGRWELCPGYSTDVWFGAAGQWIREHRDEPFFCIVAIDAPGAQPRVPEAWAAPFLAKGLDEGQARRLGQVACLDGHIGELRRMLNELGLEDNTVLVFTSAAGAVTGTAGMRGSRGSLYEGGHRVPCLVYYRDRDITGGRDVTGLTSLIDLMPTLMELCALQTSPAPEMDGSNLTQVLRGRPAAPAVRQTDRSLVLLRPDADVPAKGAGYCVAGGTWRLVGGTELYDLATDPGQERDLAGSETGRMKAMRAVYEKWWASVSDRFALPSEIAVGAPEQPAETRLSCYDWHQERETAVNNRDTVRARAHGNGYWTIRIERTGTYRVTLHPCPRGEENLRMGPARVRLQVGDRHWEQRCPAEASGESFTIPLRAGSYCLQSWVTEESGREYGAPYVYFEFIE